jgi:hypothetical protein
MTARIPNTPSWHDRLDYNRTANWDRAKADYIAQFPYAVQVQLGKTHSAEFKDFYGWCSERLGTHYRDWFIIASGRDLYTLYSRDTKWASILILTHVDKIVT